jgi:hypothetical protein
MLVNKSSKKLHEDIKINSNNSTIKGEHFTKISSFNAENFMIIRKGMTLRECFENKWFYMKYIRKYLSGEIHLARECIINLYVLLIT